MANLPTVTVTFLFTDIEGSTRLWEQHPDAMRAALARHDAVAAAILAQYAGTLVKSRGEGDSLFAVFADATQALSPETNVDDPASHPA
jgi:class 3 adenylate cyclase